MSLTETQIRSYRTNGFLSPLPALNADDVKALQEAFAEMEVQFAPDGGVSGTPFQYRPYLYQPWAAELVRHPAIVDAVSSLIGPDVLVYHLTIWVKEPGSESYISWHQDSTYFGLKPFEHVTAWLAVTDATEDMGCMSMVAGSHQEGELVPSELRQDTNLMLRGGQVLDVHEQEEQIVSLPLQAGEFSLHHTLTVHGSGPNRSSRRRIGLGISYIPTHCRCTAKQRVGATLVRGEDRFGHFDLEPSPNQADPDAGLRQLTESLRCWNAMREEMMVRVKSRMAARE